MEDTPANRKAFWTAMDRLSIALSTDTSDERVAVYWDALCDLPLDLVIGACQHAARYWHPTDEERYRFPLPVTVREYAEQHRTLRHQDAKHRQGTAERQQIPARTATTDEVGLAAIRAIIAKLSEKMDIQTAIEAPEPPKETPRQRRSQYLRSLGHHVEEEGA